MSDAPVFEFTARVPARRDHAANRAPIGQRVRFGGGEFLAGGVPAPTVHEFDDVTVLAHGRVRLDGAAMPTADAKAAARLVSAWRTDGATLLQRLDGEFLIALADARSGAWVVATDRFSSFRVYFAEGTGQVAFGTSPIAVASALGLAAQPNPQAILAYAYFHVVPAPLSIVDGVRRLEHGEALWGDGNGRTTVSTFWKPHFDEARPFDFGVERVRFLEALRTGVRECTEGLAADDVGCFLSGGTDSSTIAGLATEQFGTGARTFSIGFGIDGFDESRYAQLAVRHFGTRHTEYYLQPGDVEKALPLLASRYEQPFGNASAVPTYFCARLAKEGGVQRMLGGDGGDELYGGNSRYAKQWVLSLWSRVPGGLRSGLAEPLLLGPFGNVSLAPIRKGRAYVETARMPLPDRLQGKYNLLDRFGRDKVFTDAFLARAATFEPTALAREVWERSDAKAQINRLLAYDFKFTLADSDLPKVTRMCEVAGVEVAYPMLTRAVADYSLTVPPGQKLRRTQLRYFFKRALRGFLPDEILRKEKHGFGMPFGAWVAARPELARLAGDALDGLAARGYVRGAFVSDLRQAMATPHAGYYGTMVWILMMLELWLREHMPTARCD